MKTNRITAASLARSVAATAAVIVAGTAPAFADGKMRALEGLVRTVVEDSRAEAKFGAKLAEEARLLRGGEELFETAAKQHESFLRAAGRTAELEEAAIARRLAKLAPRLDVETTRAVAALSAPERHFAIDAAETAGRLATKYPNEATTMIRKLGPEGLGYVRAYGDDVAEIVLKEGPESLSVLRKAGRGGWQFFKESVLPHKKKLIAAGVLAAFLANPDQFVDMAGRATDYAVREFARAGVELAAGVPGAVTDGVEAGVNRTLDRWGMNYAPLRWAAISLLLLIATGAAASVLGWPLRTLARPFVFVARRFRRA